MAQLQRAVAAAHRLADAHHEHDMTHAWLLAGPPGSGRSTSALAFAAALQCPDYGCGQCRSCRLVLSGAHPDVELVIPTSVAYRADEIRGLVEQAQMMPTLGSWLIIVIEDADRLNDASANALLKALEEPTPHTVWLLCAPSAADVFPRSPRAPDNSRCAPQQSTSWSMWSAAATTSPRKPPNLRLARARAISAARGCWPLTRRLVRDAKMSWRFRGSWCHCLHASLRHAGLLRRRKPMQMPSAHR